MKAKQIKPVGRDLLSSTYQKPTTEVIEMNLEQNILNASTEHFTPGGGGGEW